MAIASAVQRGTVVYVYDERGLQICSVPSGNRPEDGLKGFTSNTVSVRRGPVIYVYNDKGLQVSSIPAGR